PKTQRICQRTPRARWPRSGVWWGVDTPAHAPPCSASMLRGDRTMASMTTISTTDKPSVQYARLHNTLEGYALTLGEFQYFVDHDAHVYTITPEGRRALTLLAQVPPPEQANVLAALARVGEVG